MLFTSCFCYFIVVIHNWLTYVVFDQAINQKILSNSTDHKAEIKIADAQCSHVDGVIVLITGCLTGKDNVGRNFTQLFFLIPQEKGYYVQNDVFRYLVEDQVLKPETVLVNRIGESITAAPVPQEHEPSHVPEPVVPDTIEPTVEELSNCVEVHEYLNNKVDVVVQEDIVEEPPQAPTPAAPTQRHGASTPNSNNASANNNVVEQVAGHSIYIKNLPTTATDEHVEKEFKSFWPIKTGGIQVRSNKVCFVHAFDVKLSFSLIKFNSYLIYLHQGFCFGFVEFEQLSSMQNAVKV
ncbi:hypothetical protein MKX03_000097 [Papaver bracteatum]|nr:hypothetical protein MKX03_000097 [Papaver bracteatum]